MQGLTTRFERPPAPAQDLITREILGIPPRPRPHIISPMVSSRFATNPVVNGNDGYVNDPARGRIGSADGVFSEGDGARCGALYLVPQTLYKLHPDFDGLVAGVLKTDPSGCAVFIQSFEVSTTEGVAMRMTRALQTAGVAPERVVFVPRSAQALF